jgi:hypothetical protein
MAGLCACSIRETDSYCANTSGANAAVTGSKKKTARNARP